MNNSAYTKVSIDKYVNSIESGQTLKIPRYYSQDDAGNESGKQGDLIFDLGTLEFYGHNGLEWLHLSGNGIEPSIPQNLEETLMVGNTTGPNDIIFNGGASSIASGSMGTLSLDDNVTAITIPQIGSAITNVARLEATNTVTTFGTDSYANFTFISAGNNPTITPGSTANYGGVVYIKGGDYTGPATSTSQGGAVVVSGGNDPNVTGPIFMQSLNQTSTTGNTGDIDIVSGNLSNTATTGYSGNVTIGTGALNSSSISSGSTSGIITLATGPSDALSGDIEIQSGAANASGNIGIVTGASNDNSGTIQLVTGDSASGNTGDIDITSGNLSNTATSGDSGNVTISTGTLNSPSISSGSTSGIITLSTGASDALSGPVGIQSGAANASGNIGIATGASNDNSGTIQLVTGDSASGNTGNIDITSGNLSNTATTGYSGNVTIATGTLNSPSIGSGSSSGIITLLTGASDASSGPVIVSSGAANASGNVGIATGASNDNSGTIRLVTGDSASGNSGNVILQTGYPATSPAGLAGNIILSSGNQTNLSASGGEIQLQGSQVHIVANQIGTSAPTIITSQNGTTINSAYGNDTMLYIELTTAPETSPPLSPPLSGNVNICGINFGIPYSQSAVSGVLPFGLYGQNAITGQVYVHSNVFNVVAINMNNFTAGQTITFCVFTLGFSGTPTIPPPPIAPTIETVSISPSGTNPIADVTLDITSDGGSAILQRGLVYAASPNTTPTLANYVDTDPGTSTGTFTMFGASFTNTPAELTYVAGFATNAVGTSYGYPSLSFVPQICLAIGTKILLADHSEKNIEDVRYDDLLLVWNFDDCKFDVAKPLWIAKPRTAERYNLLKFSDGSHLKTIDQHRIFNTEKGGFSYPMTDDTPIGTSSFNSRTEHPTLISKEIVNEQIDYCNIITYFHINMFANGILTSCRYNNIYPIKDMKFVKKNVAITTHVILSIPTNYLYGLRVLEQSFTEEEHCKYIKRLELLKRF